MLLYNWLILISKLLHVITENSVRHALFDIRQACPDCCYGIPLNVYSTIHSTIACSDLCTRFPECQSWMYSPDNETCQTNANTMTTVNTSCPKQIRYGERQKQKVHPQYQEFKRCNCLMERVVCRQGKCECKNGFPYDHRTDSCPKSCDEYGDTVHEVFYRLPLRLKAASFNNLSQSQCLEQCFTIKDITCRHILMTYPRQTCYLFEVTIRDARTSSFDNGQDMVAWDRNCA